MSAQIHRRALLGAAGALAASTARSQTAAWAPSRTVTMVVPFSAGGTTDVMARMISVPMSRHFGQSVVVENVTGAGGNVGAARVARADPDGHTILLAHIGVLSVNQHLYRNMPFDAVRDFATVGLVCTNPMMVMVSARAGIPDLAALKERARQGNLRIATSGNGSTMHLAALQFLRSVGGHADLIPYRGGGQAVNDLVAGTVDMFLEQALGGIPHVLAGTVKGFAVTGPRRLEALPQVPTATEAGLDGLDIEIWNGLTLPSAATPAMVGAHNAALSVALDDPAVRHRFGSFAGRIPSGEERSPGELSRIMAHDSAAWGELLRAANIGKEG
jgi:tripartite-type tricarboxylate transporter receptor subunit TctC